MTIETKFNVNDLVTSKFDRNIGRDNTIVCMEVLDIHTRTSLGGVEIRYDVKPIYGIKENGFSSSKEPFINFFPGEKEVRLREDELVLCFDDIVQQVTGNKKV